MKALFLDIDGVLNCATTKERYRDSCIGICPERTKILLRILMETECDVVLSSTWRLYPELKQEVEKHIYLYGCTDKVVGEVRGVEIALYLKKHPEITRYAIVDDSADMLEEQEDCFFQTTWKDGLTAKIAKQIILHLK